MSNLDIKIQNAGSIFLLHGISEDGKNWLAENIHRTDETQMWCGAIVVEHRFIEDIAAGAYRDGMIIGFDKVN